MGLGLRATARELGVSHPSLLNAVKTGRVTRNADGSFDLERAKREWQQNTNLSNGRNAVTGQPRRPLAEDPNMGGVNQSRAVFEAFRAALAKLEYQKRSGQLIPAADVKKAAFNEARRVRDHLLSIPDRVASVICGMDDPAEAHALLTTEIRNALQELSGMAEVEKAS